MAFLYRVYAWVRNNALLTLSFLGLFIIVLAAFLYLGFSSSVDRGLKQDAKESAKIEKIKEEQEKQLLGDLEYSAKTMEYPTKEQFKTELNSLTGKLGLDYSSSAAGDEIEERYDWRIAGPFRRGALVSDSLTSEQKLVVRNLQENWFYELGEVEKPLVYLDDYNFRSVYLVYNFISSAPRVQSIKLTFTVEGGRVDLTGFEASEYFNYFLDLEGVEVYRPTALNLAENGFRTSDVVVVYNRNTGELKLDWFVNPSDVYTYEEFKNLFKNQTIRIDGDELTFNDIVWDKQYPGKVLNHTQLIRVSYVKSMNLAGGESGELGKLVRVTEESYEDMK